MLSSNQQRKKGDKPLRRAWGARTASALSAGGGALWGAITGTLSDQTDLQTALDLKLNASSYTAADVFAKVLTLDGTGSALDSDLLDGQHGTYYLARANHTGTQLAATISDFSTAVGLLNSLTATTLQTSRNFSIGGSGITAAAVGFNGSAAVVLAASVDAGHITLARMADVATSTVFYRKTAGTGTPEVQTLATLKTDLGLTGTNSGDQTITLTSDVTGSGTGTFAATLATVNSNVGSFGSATQVASFTVNAKGLTTAASNVTITPAVGSITGLGTGVATFLATPSSANLIAAVTDETGTGSLVFATSPTLVTPALGTPSSGNLANCTFPTLNQNTTGSAATLTTSRNFSISGGGITAAAVGFNGSAVVTLNASVDAGHITLARMADMATSSLIYRKTAGTGTPEVQTLATLKTDLGLTGTNSGDQTITLTGDITGSGTGSFATTLATVNSNVGTFGSATKASVVTVNAKGLVTAASESTVTPAVGSITGLGTGVATFLATPSSANLLAAMTDETGTGACVFATSPTLVTPDIGAAIASGLFTTTVAAGQPNIRASQTTGSIAVNGTYDFAALSQGYFFVGEVNATGQVAIFSTDGSTVRLVYQSGTAYTTTINNAGTINVYYNAGAPRIQNKLAAAAILNVFVLKLT